MKTLILKNMMPFAVVAMGISGAFVTTSMQSDSKSNAPKLGYTLNGQGACNVQVNCSDIPNQVCRLNGATGPQAFAKNAQGNCNEIVYRP
jgi:hypothetical protein